MIIMAERIAGTAHEKAPRAPVRARLSLLPSGPGEVHEMYAARGVPKLYPVAEAAWHGARWRHAEASVSWLAEDSPRGLGRTLGKRVGIKPSRVRISYPPPLNQAKRPTDPWIRPGVDLRQPTWMIVDGISQQSSTLADHDGADHETGTERSLLMRCERPCPVPLGWVYAGSSSSIAASSAGSSGLV
jgi:hypothetical protein